MGMKSHKKVFIGIVGIISVLLIFCVMVLNLSQLHFDFSQNYRSLDGYESIVFKDDWNKQCFRLCAWGLIKTGDADGFEDNRNPDITSDEYRLVAENTNAKECDIWQVVPSPDGRYILYVEKIYRGSGLTDDEDVYYKVYSIDDGSTTTIYSGYRQYFLVDWK